MEDQTHRQKRNPNPREKANLFSTLTYLYTFPLFFYGNRNIITEDNIYETFSKHKSNVLGKRAKELWEKELQNAKFNKSTPSLIKIIIKLTGWKYLSITIALGISELLIKPLQTWVLGQLVLCYSSEETTGKPYLHAVGIIILSIASMAITQPCLMESFQITLRMRIICSSIIYDKILKLDKRSVGQAMSGQIVNMLSNDIGLFDKFPFTTQLVLLAPIQTIIYTCLMCKEIGVSAVFGIFVLVVFVPIYFVLGKHTRKLRTKISARRDERLRLMNETIIGIKVIKMYTWEKAFEDVISKCRNFEINTVSKLISIKFLLLFYSVFGILSVYVTITSSMLLNYAIEAKSVFIITSFFASLSITLSFLLPSGLLFLGEVGAAFKRINNFLLSNEIESSKLGNDQKNAFTITQALAKWEPSSNYAIFDNLNVNVKWRTLTTVIGPIGSGKSSLVQLLLRELPLSNGEIQINGTLSYASQEPWIFMASVRQNILFGSAMDQERYEKVIKCCALDDDLKLLPYNDNTSVGERGDCLSGGQKARISLARAIYKQADIYLLDNPLAAVDSCVSKQIFSDCIRGFLKNKTVVLVTHQLEFLKYADNIIALDGGRVKAQGSQFDLEQSGFNFVKYLGRTAEDGKNINTLKEDSKKVHPMNKQPVKQQEHSEAGKIPLSVFKEYFFKSRSYVLVTLIAVLFILTQIASSAASYFVATWVNLEQTENPWQRNQFLLLYTGIIAITVIFTFLQLVAATKFANKTSVSFHNSMFRGVVYGTLSFFNSNSAGRILNRFAKDLAYIDEQLPHSLLTTIRSFLNVIGIFALVMIINLKLIIPTIITLICLHHVRKFYLSTSLNLLRTESVVRSYLYGHVNTSIQGLSTIRSASVQDVVTNEYYYHQDTHITVSDMYYATARAFGYWTDTICIVYIIVVIMYFTLGSETYGGNVGLGMTQALQLMNLVTWSVRQMTEVENYMVSTERALEYTSLQPECPNESRPMQKPPQLWPDKGRIQFIDVQLKYSEIDSYILKNLSFTVLPQEKVGIVGRTGAGKSSIITSLFQLYKTEGSIIIDGMDVKDIDVRDLRKKMSIIPQDPVLFTGTVRQNLDPLEDCNDDVIWMALEDVRLKLIIEKMGLGLNSKLCHDGLNLSVGQRQLICLARAIIRNNKILILDEATANVDHETDEIIQETIRTKFGGCTVLTIAHRLNTVIDSDKILVMDSGEMVEFDHPYILLKNKTGLFYNMVHQNENSVSNLLTSTAQKNYEQKL